ncbi:MAG TPA: hypothetical protein VEJ63_14750, partial [Planctomycetota bacterium]|nr:hypothetical protein [Planctomycetota bacterium]
FRFLDECAGLEIIATIFCGPGALIIGFLLYTFLKGFEASVVRERILCSMWVGALLAFFNFPGYLALAFVDLSRVVALFLVAGASSGAWLAWQAYRSQNPGAPIFPRFSLGTLMLIVLAWGALLLIFAPQR